MVALLELILIFFLEFDGDDVGVYSGHGKLLVVGERPLGGPLFLEEVLQASAQLAGRIGVVIARVKGRLGHGFLDDQFFVAEDRFYGKEFEICCSFLLFALFILLTCRHLIIITLFPLIALSSPRPSPTLPPSPSLAFLLVAFLHPVLGRVIIRGGLVLEQEY